MKLQIVKCLTLSICLAIIGCLPGSTDPTGDPTGDSGSDPSSSGASITGKISLPGASKLGLVAKTSTESFQVIAQSNETGEIYRGTTDETGSFEINIPDTEAGNSFMVTILGPDGRPVGPVMFGTLGDDGLTGLTVDDEVSLGTIELPNDPTAEPIEPGDDADADIEDLVDPDITARVDDAGVPVGLESHGKGDSAMVDDTGDGGEDKDQVVDPDKDGLIDMFDADDNGNGTVDDFDVEGTPGGIPCDLNVSFFMNLKVDAERAQTYYSGTPDQIAERLSNDTVITFDVTTEPIATRAIVSANILETPGPSYLPRSGVTISVGPEDEQHALWAANGYALQQRDDRFDAFVCPNAVMDAGDTFTVEITFDDGTTEQHSRMVNYVFKNIPKLLKYGSEGNLTDFDVTSEMVNGTYQKPILFDGTKDLVLEFQPPPDETGAPIIGMGYSFQLFFHSDRELGPEIDVEATWPDPIENLDGMSYWIQSDQMGSLSSNGTYTVTLPREAFPDTVVLQSGEQVEVRFYKIDITAEASTGNAAIMLAYEKQ